MHIDDGQQGPAQQGPEQVNPPQAHAQAQAQHHSATQPSSSDTATVQAQLHHIAQHPPPPEQDALSHYNHINILLRSLHAERQRRNVCD